MSQKAVFFRSFSLRDFFTRTGPHRFWAGVFGVWLILLSGILNPWVGGPGLLQWARLKRLHSQRLARLTEMENQVIDLSSEQVRLEKSAVLQQHEIRRVLGYVRPDELVFDFSEEGSIPSPQAVARR